MDIKEIRLTNMLDIIDGVSSQREFCDLAGIESSYVSQIKNPSNPKNIGEKLARRIEKAMDKPPGWMDQLHKVSRSIESKWMVGDQEPEDTNIEPGLDITGMVPLISWVSAGMWCEAIDNYSPGDAEDWLPCPVKCHPRTYALRVNGDSMTSMIPGAKTYPDRCIIYIDPDVQVTNNRRVIARLIDKNKVTFKTYREDAGEKWLVPINPQYDKILIDDNVIICGVVIAKYEPE